MTKLKAFCVQCVVLVAFALPSTAQETCATVDARQGWQPLELGFGQIVDWSTSGGWTVDSRTYVNVGLRGHKGKAARALEPFEQYKYSRIYDFGVLLMSANKEKSFAVHSLFPKIVDDRAKATGDTIWLRINDADTALGDNAGAITFCVMFS